MDLAFLEPWDGSFHDHHVLAWQKRETARLLRRVWGVRIGARAFYARRW